MRSRREFVLGALAAPAVLKSAATPGYSWAEIEKIVARGDVRGKLTRDDLPTPALLLDMDAFEANVAKMAGHLRERKRSFRPHAKTHKCPEIARRLVRAGAAGVCAAKLSEAEVFAHDGVGGLLVTTAVIGRHKIERAVRLASRRPNTMFCVDNAQNVRDLNDAAGAAKVRVNLAVDLWVGGRTGIVPGEPAVALAALVESLPHVKFAGLQSYAGHASHTVGFENRTKVSHEAMGQAVETARLLAGKGIACPLVTGGSTGTYNIDSEIDGVTELQPGSFIFMDLDYNRIGGADGPVYRDFKNSLTVLTTVVSRPNDSLAIVDGGLKAFSTDKPYMPEAKGIQGIQYSWGGDEHGRLNIASASTAVNVGDRIEFIVPHCDPSVNLYDRIWCLRGDQVEAVWPISARGMSQ
ncbi:MAG TPA: DSD1 family PLP-dependent enzyme [Bryobacteraceae bacterium]|nr:DSD1 family PLP-dependent enzyme [Bryobacteraceae bacterium]